MRKFNWSEDCLQNVQTRLGYAGMRWELQAFVKPTKERTKEIKEILEEVIENLQEIVDKLPSK